MSGGSLDYVHNDMESGRVDNYADRREYFLEIITRTLGELERGELMSGWVPPKEGQPGRYEPYANKAEAQIALAAVVAKVVRVDKLIAALQEELHDLVPIARVADRIPSGDDAPYHLADACVAWMRKTLGLPERAP